MKKLLLLFCAFSSLYTYAQPTKSGSKASTSQKTNLGTTQDAFVPLEKVLDLANQSIQLANDSLASSGITAKVSEAEVTFQVTRTTEYGGGFKILIFKFGKTWTKEYQSTLSFTLSSEKENKANLTPYSPSQLASFIVSAAKQFNAVKDKGTISGLKGSEFSIEVEFSIEKKSEAGLEWELSPITLNGDGSYTNKIAHTLKLTVK